MPSIHVIHDPLDVVRHPRGDEMRNWKVSHVVVACQDEFTKEEVADLVKTMGDRLLAKVAKK